MKRPCEFTFDAVLPRSCNLFANWRVVDTDKGEVSFVCDRHLVDIIRAYAARRHLMLVEALSDD